MLKKTITYVDFNDVTHTEDFYFHLSTANLAELAMIKSVGGKDFGDYLVEIVQSSDGTAIIENFKMLLGMTVGRKSEDGKRFIKSPEITSEFMDSNAYDVFLLELVTDAKGASEFVRGIMPSDLSAKLEEADKAPEKREYTQLELMEMSTEEFQRVVGDSPKDMSHDQLIAAMARKQRDSKVA